MSTTSTAPQTNGTTDGRPRTADESTQTNGISEPNAGKLNKEGVEKESRWSVESGMS